MENNKLEKTQNILKWKTPIWFTRNAQCTRILRYSEAKAVIGAIRNEKTGAQWEYTLEVPRSVIQIWLQALLFTGMRPSELWILHEHPELMQSNGSILLERDKFYDVGKQKQKTKERSIYLSDLGMQIIEKFFDTPMLADTFPHANYALDTMLHRAGKEIGLPERTFTRRLKKEVGTKEIKKGDNTKTIPIYEKVDSVQITNGLMLRSFRKTWDSWLVNSFHDASPMFLMLIEKSIGHSIETAMEHYLTFDFDQEDLDEIKKATKGFGSLRIKKE